MLVCASCGGKLGDSFRLVVEAMEIVNLSGLYDSYSDNRKRLHFCGYGCVEHWVKESR